MVVHLLTSVKLTDLSIRESMLTRKCLRRFVDILLFWELISSIMCWMVFTFELLLLLLDEDDATFAGLLPISTWRALLVEAAPDWSSFTRVTSLLVVASDEGERTLGETVKVVAAPVAPRVPPPTATLTTAGDMSRALRSEMNCDTSARKIGNLRPSLRPDCSKARADL